MKVISVKKKECEEIQFDNNAIYSRYSADNWHSINYIIVSNIINELEVAYQKFKDPPFKAKCDAAGVVLTIKDKDPIYFTSHYPSALKEKLEQALNSLMEGK